jgi:plastocyanin
MRIVLIATLGLLAACTAGSVGDDDVTPPGDDMPPGDDEPPPPPPDPRVALTMSPSSIDSELGSIANDFTITVNGYDGFAGPVTLAFTGVPADWNAAFDNPTVTVPTNGSATAILNIRVPTDAVAATATISVSATSSAAPATVPAPSTLAIENQYTVHIAPGAGGDPLAHGLPQSIRLKAGAALRFQNDDTTAHRIHSNDDAIIPHEPEGPTAEPGGIYTVQMTTTGETTVYCHDHGDGGVPTQLIIQ